MGGDLATKPAGSNGPTFLLQAMRDIEGLDLERAQIIKGWHASDGTIHEKIYDVAGTPGTGSVDTNTCETSGTGSKVLCSAWTDPDFDPTQRAFYYARVVELPSCRWSTLLCNSLPPDERPKRCEDKTIPKAIQERVWSSPIWFTP